MSITILLKYFGNIYFYFHLVYVLAYEMGYELGHLLTNMTCAGFFDSSFIVVFFPLMLSVTSSLMFLSQATQEFQTISQNANLFVQPYVTDLTCL